MFCSKCGHNVSEGAVFCQNCGQQINNSLQANNDLSSKQVSTEKKDAWYYLGKIFGENREDTIRKTKRDGLIVAALVFILILFPNNALFSAFDESYKISDPLNNIIDDSNRIGDSLNEAMLFYNTEQYDIALTKLSDTSNELDVLEGKIDDLSDRLDSVTMNKEKKLLYRNLLFSYKQSAESEKDLLIYMQYAAESAQKKNYDDADRYIKIANNRMEDCNEYTETANKIMNEISQL